MPDSFPSRDGTPAIFVQNLVKEYGSGESKFAALGGIDFEVRRGEFVAVMGRSGSGKSTLLHLIAGLDVPTSGSILVGDRNLAALTDDELTKLRRREIGLIFQAFNLIEVLTAEENAALPLVIDGVAEAEAHRRAEASLARVGLAARRHHLPREMSGGEQQRVAIARALVAEPLLLLADEPTGNLDSANSEQIVALLRALVAERGVTVLMVTHDRKQAEIADRWLEIRDGHWVA